MRLIHNERVKLLAATFNTLGIATIVTGLIAPLISSAYGLTSAKPSYVWLALATLWLGSGTLLHFLAKRVLGDLKE